MRQLSYFDRVISVGIVLLVALLLCTFAGCSKDDDTSGGGNKPKGDPYKVKIEISTETPDIYTVYLNNGYYNVYDKDGKTNPVSFTTFDDYLTSYPSPLIKEFDLPRNFDGLAFTCGLRGNDIDSYKVYIKIFVKDRLLLSYEENRQVILFLYQKENKFFVDINYRIAVFEFDKLD